VKDPLPADVDSLFEGRRPVPEGIKLWHDERYPAQPDSPAEPALESVPQAEPASETDQIGG